MATPPRTIPYGSASVRADGAAGLAVTLTVGRALRLNDAGWAFTEPPDASRLADPAAALAFLRDHLKTLCDPWAAHQARFLDAYFRCVADAIARDAAALAVRLARFGTLYRVEDFGFSALRPLPRAHVPDAADWLAVDFAFWTGAALIALDIADGRRTARRRASDHARLAAAGASVISLAPEALAGDLAAHLPDALLRFCDGENLPSSPFKAATLGDIVDAETPQG